MLDRADLKGYEERQTYSSRVEIFSSWARHAMSGSTRFVVKDGGRYAVIVQANGLCSLEVLRTGPAP